MPRRRRHPQREPPRTTKPTPLRRRRPPKPRRRRPKPPRPTTTTTSHPRRAREIIHRITAPLPLGVVAVGDAVDDALRLLVPDLLVVVDDVAQVVAAGIVGFAHAHAVVREVDVAVVAKEFGHCGGVLFKRTGL